MASYKKAIVVFASVLAVFTGAIHGQLNSFPGMQEDMELSDQVRSRDNAALFSSQAMAVSDPVDNSIDERTYRVGGGDQFQISVVDMPSMVYVGTINQSGDLYVPALGIVPVGDVPLVRAKEIISAFVKGKLKKPGDLNIALSRIKRVIVSISGPVVSPGTHELHGALRLWDAIRVANAQRLDDPTKPILNEFDFRTVRRVNRDSVTWFDLMSFVVKGEMSQNPYVYPGDEITLFPVTNRVFIGGGINGPLRGMVPIGHGEQLGEFLELFALDENADSTRILIQRTDDNKRPISLSYDFKQRPDMLLKNGDLISVPLKKDFSELFAVEVIGEVQRPGLYPIAKSETPVKEIVGKAGGYTSFANADKAVIIRRGKLPEQLQFRTTDKLILTTNPESVVRPELSAALGTMTSTKDFTVIRIKDNPESVLEPKDQLYIPRAERMVFISGNVKRPGGYTFVPGKAKSYYIGLAGGYTNMADPANEYVVAYFMDTYQTTNRDVVEDGDIVVVPMSQQFKVFSQVILPSLGILMSAVGVTLSVIALIINAGK
ncbi:MAG: SLBB domain-containing protein [Chitinispirillaceae bacterium]|jgi:protein involved in polysaccharide export with SLBB domain|nr:SLBB domain-containing protein [Chitinispirillaceae bacterium]